SAFEISRDEDGAAESAKGAGVDFGREISGGVHQLLQPAGPLVRLLSDPQGLERKRDLEGESDVVVVRPPFDRSPEIVQLGGRDLEPLAEVDRVEGQVSQLGETYEVLAAS